MKKVRYVFATHAELSNPIPRDDTICEGVAHLGGSGGFGLLLGLLLDGFGLLLDGIGIGLIILIVTAAVAWPMIGISRLEIEVLIAARRGAEELVLNLETTTAVAAKVVALGGGGFGLLLGLGLGWTCETKREGGR